MDWKALVDEFGDVLLLYARRWSSSIAEAEDFVQEGFLRFWRLHADGKVADENAKGLLFESVKRAALDGLRKERRRKDREADASGSTPCDTQLFESAVEKDEERTAMEKALLQLPADQAETLVMKIWGDMTFKEIGECVGISPNTAASRYRLGLAAMRELLEKDEEYEKRN